MTKQFPINPTLVAMSYKKTDENYGDLAITFRKGGQVRTYHGVEVKVAYGLYYKESAGDTMSYYSKNIRKKYKVTVN